MVDLAVDLGIIKKSGAWFSYEDGKIGQGRENTKEWLKNNPDKMKEIEEKIKNSSKSSSASIITLTWGFSGMSAASGTSVFSAET